jgi:hypothetical protein
MVPFAMGIELPRARSLATLLALGIGLGLLGSWLIGSIIVSWWKNLPAGAAVAPAVDVTLATPDGLFLAAIFWPGLLDNSPAVLVLHGLGDARQAVAANPNWLANKGFAAMAINFCGHGQSSGAPHSFGLTESIDAQTAFDWHKKRQQGAPVGVIGISLGGARAFWARAGRFPPTRSFSRPFIPISGARFGTGSPPFSPRLSPGPWNLCSVTNRGCVSASGPTV